MCLENVSKIEFLVSPLWDSGKCPHEHEVPGYTVHVLGAEDVMVWFSVSTKTAHVSRCGAGGG